MDEFNYHSTYSSGWRRISKEKSETEDRRVEELLKSISVDPQRKPVVAYDLKSHISPQTHTLKTQEKTTSEPNIHEIIHEATKPIKQAQSDIMTRLSELQNDLVVLKQLLGSINEKSSRIQQEEQKKTTGSKLSRFFK